MSSSSSIQFEEYPDSRSATSNPQTRTLHYWLDGIHDDAAARAYVTAATPLLFDGYYRQNINMDPKGNGFWEIDVPYGAIDQCTDIGTVSISYETSGGSAHMTLAKQHIASYGPTESDTPPDHGGALNVTEQGVQGVDVVTAEFSWTETWTLPIAYASFPVAMINKACTGKINAYTFRGFGPKQVRLDGVTMTASTKDPTQATGVYKFVQSDDSTDAVPLFRSGIVKAGWDFLWAEYAKQEDDAAKALVQKAIAVHIDRVYDLADFSILGIGTGLPS